MKAHFFMSMGLLIAAIFVWRGMEALADPGIGLREVYILGGFIVAGLLFHHGWTARRESG